MICKWFKRTTSVWIPLIILSLLLVIGCGSAAEQAGTAETEVAKTEAVKTMAKDQSVAAPTAIPQAADQAQLEDAKLQRVVVAISPMGWDTNFTYRVSTTGLLDKRPVQEHLLGINRVTGAYEPQLATAWEMAPNGKDWTFTLRKGVQWHGEADKPEGWGEFTARDVRHTTYMHVEPQSLASNGGAWRKITGVSKDDRKLDNAKMVVAQKIESNVEIVDDYTLVYHSQTVQPELDYYHSVNRGYPIISKARWDMLGDDGIERAIVGTGPLKFIERKEAQHVLYEAVEDHWRVTPQYNELEFRWVSESATRLATLLTGEVHMADIERALQATARDQGMKVIRSKFPGMHVSWGYFGLYFTVPEYLDPDLPWLDVRVRRAMQKAIDSQGIADALLGGSEVEYPAIYGFHPALDEEMWPELWNDKWFEDWDEYYGYDPERAKELLVEAGYPNGFEFTIHLTPLSGLPEIVDIGQAIAVDFQKLGLKPKLVEIDYPVSRAMARNHEASGILRPSRSSHRTILSATSYSTKDSSYHIYTDPELDLVIEELERTVDNRERARLLQKLGDIQYYDNARIQMFGLYVEMTVNPKYISNYDFPATMSGYFSHLEYIETVPQ
jgi:ABC-type transport system substrate-binding protein